jgi:hypothetical protein
VLILAGCSVLNVTYPSGNPNGPGTGWSALLKRWGGPLTAILGYKDKAPFDRIEGTQIAALMGKKIAAGLDPERWVQVWLQLHVNPDQKRLPEFRNAVGMDQKGYWSIGKRGGLRQLGGDPQKFDQDYSINGPEPLL